MPAHKNYRVNRDAFKPPLSAAAEYWLGFLLADGNIDQGGYWLQILLRAGDRDHLQKFRTFMKAETPIYDRFINGYSLVQLRIGSVKICQDLIALGVVPRKSLKQRAADCVKHSWHFWRGIIDGNGYVSMDRLQLSGGKTLLRQWIQFSRHRNSTPKLRQSRSHASEVFYATCYGRTMRRLLHHLYSKASVAMRLERKFQIAVATLSRFPQEDHT